VIHKPFWLGPLVVGLFLTLAGCASLDQSVVHSINDILSKDGNNTVFTGDNDPKLVGDALPFTIKMYESLAASDPTHPGMARTVGMLEIMYANAYVAGPADYLGVEHFAEKQAAQKRALNLYLRGRDFVLKSIDLRYPGFLSAWRSPDGALESYLVKFQKSDVSSLYWVVAGQLSAFSLNPMDLELSFPVPKVLKLLTRAYALDPDYQKAALEELLVTVYASLPPTMGGDPELARVHFALAQQKTGGKSTSAFLAYATGIDLPQQNKAHFVELLNKVLAVPAESDPDTTLSTLLNQERARWYLSQVDDLFID